MTEVGHGISSGDLKWMARAIALAAEAGPAVRPNPPVGCVLVRDGVVVGEGAHQRCGGPHAEVHALQAAGPAAVGATAYVTLEPCAHHGRTPPCCDALIEAGVQEVVIAVSDPNPDASGGIAKLRAAGLEVRVGVMSGRASALAEIFLVNTALKRPHITLKMAASMDGFTAADDGSSQWITGAEARREVHLLRSDREAVMVGSGTALHDNPRLTPYLVDDSRQPLRVVLDRRLRLPTDGHLADTSTAPTLVCTAASAPVEARRALEARGVEVWSPDSATHSDAQWLGEALIALLDRDVFSVLVEGGATLAGSLLRAGLVDRIDLVKAPILLGSGTPLWPTLGINTLAEARRWRWGDLRAVGHDVWMTARPHPTTWESSCSPASSRV